MDTPERYYHDQAAVDRVIRFFRELLIHVKGEWAGQPFELLPWQLRDVVTPLFGVKRTADHLRRYRTAYIEVPRKNGKSNLVAGLALVLTFFDNEDGAEVYGAASDRDQAKICFNLARQMMEASPVLMKLGDTFRNTIVYHRRASTYKAISADVKTKHGFNAHAIIVDELHTQRDREMVDILRTSTGSRRQPMEIYITTAGYDRHSICWEMHEYAMRVQKGIIQDDSFLPVIYAADDEDDWRDPAIWKKANPSYGITIKEEYLRERCKEAQEKPAFENSFRRLHLNQWTKQDSRWMPMLRWKQCGSSPIDEKALRGRACYSGLDLASTTDIAALVHVFPDEDGTYTILPRFFIPKDSMLERSKRDKVPYDLWEQQGWLTATEGNVIDYATILKQLDEDAQKFSIQELAYDRWGATMLIQQIQDAGLLVVPFGQGFASMSPPTKELLNLVLLGRIAHGDNPILTWMADNVVVEQDAAGNLKPSKKKSTEKIDGIVAAIMGLARAIAHDASVYESEGVKTV